jgi:4-amino-4-deoxy-L-arabinose transferase-like glycosyltransferase
MTDTQHQSISWWEWLLLALLVLLFGWLGASSSLHKSAAFDEQYHLAAGASYLFTGDYRIAVTHPPLAGLIAAFGLLGQDEVVIPVDDASWQESNQFTFADEFMWRANDHAQTLLVAARIPILLLGMLLMGMVWLWARQAWGRWASWIALLLAVFDPNLLSNSRLVTSDLALTCFFFLAMWQFWHWLKRPLWRHLLFVGMFAGLAMASKYTGLLFAPIVLLGWLIYPVESGQRKSQLVKLLGMGLIGLVTLWAVYRFDVSVIPGFPVSIPLPAPYFWQNMWATFVKLPTESTAKLNFLLGQVSPGGWWYYFPVALAVKTPLPTLILLTLGVIMLVRNGRLRHWVSIWLPPLAFLTLGMTGILTIGYRHILPAIPFVILIAAYGGSCLVARLTKKRPAQSLSKGTLPAIVLGLLMIWLIFRSASIYPHQEAYFNELGGDWTNWSQILVDSNLDWGQDLIALRQLMHDYGLSEVNLAYFGMAYPEHYGIHYKPLPGYLKFAGITEGSAYNPYTPAPGWYAISATSLRLGTLSPETADYYAFFREMTPVNHAGYSIYLYHIPEEMYEDVNRTVATGKPVALYSPEELGIQPSQRTIAKWTGSSDTVIYPLGDGFDADYISVEANFEDVMSLLGYELGETTQDSLSLTLYWKVGEQTMAAPAPALGSPLSAFVHLTGEEVWQVVTQFDGWDTTLRGLEPGDVIAQHVSLPLSDVSSGKYTLLTGLYSPQTGERLAPKTAVSGEDYMRLQEVVIE